MASNRYSCYLRCMKTAVIYARVSSIGDRQSTTRQIEDLTRYAKYSELKIVRIFEEHISGAKKNSERPVLSEAFDYVKANKISYVLISELSRLGRNTFEVLTIVKEMIDAGINIYFQKEQFSLLDEDRKPSLFAPIMIATLSTCAQLERENIQFRLESGRKLYVEHGGRLGRKVGSTKSLENKKEEYRNVLRELRRGTSVRRTAKLCDISASTVMRLKHEFGI